MNPPPCICSWRTGGMIVVFLEIVCSIYSLWLVSVILSWETMPDKCPSEDPNNSANLTSNNTRNCTDNASSEDSVNTTSIITGIEEYKNASNQNTTVDEFNCTTPILWDNSTEGNKTLYPAHTRASIFYNYVSFVLHSGDLIFAILLLIAIKKSNLSLMKTWVAYKLINCVFSLVITVTSIFTYAIYQCRNYQQVTDSMLFILYMYFMFVIFAVIQETKQENETQNKKPKKF